MPLIHLSDADVQEFFNSQKDPTNANRVAQALLRVNADLDTLAALTGANAESQVALFDDFVGPASTALPAWLTTQDTSTMGTPVLAKVADAPGGQFTLTHDNTNEAQNITLYGGDSQCLPLPNAAGEKLVFEARVKLSAQLTAVQRAVVGLATDRNATLDNVATHAWFRFEGANLNILWETDDATTDDDDNDTGVDYAADTFVLLRIEIDSAKAVKFFVNGVHVGSGTIANTAATVVQPFIEFQKDSGTTTEYLRIDWIRITASR